MLGRDRTSTALALLRIVTALLFIEHGTAKLIGWPESEMPQPPIGSFMWIGGVLEAVGGLLVLLGLFTRPVAFLLAGEMAVAYWMFHAPQGPFPMNNGGDASILFCFVFLFLAAAGPGRFALDNSRSRTARID
jgi:putative oxidoreductase